jgi:DNA repair exonuclease SbcCD nuclease subunit
MRLFCAADLHLGRVPSRLPGDLPLAESELAPAAAWHALVDACLDEGADALLLAGDLLDDDRDLFGAFADLEGGLRRLDRAGIAVVAVAGNHDVRSLPRLAAALPNLRQLGRGGRWEAVDLGGSGPPARVVGWSFPDVHVTRSPLEAPGRELLDRDDVPTIGLLHADLDAGGGRYAPVASADLAATAVDVWLLGHVHVPSDFAAGLRTGYLGSLAAVDPGETGPRGAWLLAIEDGELRFERRALAPLRYLTVRCDIDGADPDDALARVSAAVREAAFGDDAARATAIRLDVRGRVTDPGEVRRALAFDPDAPWTLEREGHVAFVHDLIVSVAARHDLTRLARLDDPVGVAARTLLTLRDPATPEHAGLLASARERLAEVGRRNAFRALDPPQPSDDELRERLDRATLRVLDELLASRDRSPS